MKTLIALWLLASSAHAQVDPVALAQADKYFAEMMQGRSPGTGTHSANTPVTNYATTQATTGNRTYVLPSGTYMTSRVGSTTYVIQASKSR